MIRVDLSLKCLKIDSCFSLRAKIKKMIVNQKVDSFYSALKASSRESLIREEVSDNLRTGTSKLNKENLRDLVMMPKSKKELLLRGDESYRILRCPIADEFNYIMPGVSGIRQSEFIISQYTRPEYKLCSLDVVNAAVYLAFYDPNRVKEL